MPLSQTQIEQELADDIRCDACGFSDKCNGWRQSSRCYVSEQPAAHAQLAIGFWFKVRENKCLRLENERIRGVQVFFELDPKQIKLSYPKLSQRLITASHCTFDPEYGYILTLNDIEGKTLTIKHYVSRMVMAKGEPKVISNDELRNILTSHKRAFDTDDNRLLHPFFIGHSNAVG